MSFRDYMTSYSMAAVIGGGISTLIFDLSPILAGCAVAAMVAVDFALMPPVHK